MKRNCEPLEKSFRMKTKKSPMGETPSLSAIRIFRNGPYMGAVLGLNLQEGESEFARILPPFGPTEESAAGERAAQLLENRLNLGHLNLQRVYSEDEVPRVVRWTGEF
jgi:hypothetical protein